MPGKNDEGRENKEGESVSKEILWLWSIRLWCLIQIRLEEKMEGRHLEGTNGFFPPLEITIDFY